MAEETAPNSFSASVPMSIGDAGVDTSALSKALQAIIAENTPTEKRVNPATFIHDAGSKMVELYSVYEKLRAIGVQLNGKLMSDPIPNTLAIDDITINFRTVTGETVSEPQAVSLRHITTVGDISNLLSTELGAIIVLLQRETDAVLDIATRTKDMCAKSRKAWEENNKDKKILEANAETDIESVDSTTVVAETIADSVAATLNDVSLQPAKN